MIVPAAVIFDAFGVDATVTVPSGAAVATKVVWRSTVAEEVPDFGDRRGEFQRKEPLRMLSILKSAVPTVPIGTMIVAAEAPGDAVRSWRVDGAVRAETDIARVIVVPVG